ncbi:MAG TPA: EF-hand domain-containing protein [Sphingomicrobium sp.]|nr:EF-hand domain-containing protein [Sphingomicrobium sp.]
MARFLAGAAACFLLLTGAFLLWQSRAQQGSTLPPAPPPRGVAPAMVMPGRLEAPEASPKSREERRFSRADRNKNGRIEAEELLSPRRKAFAKLDSNGDGRLTFDEWAAKTIDKFRGADGDKSGWLTPAEYATTAPPPPKKPRCAC